MPRLSASSHVKRTSAHQSGVKATSPAVGLFRMDAAHGVQASAMPKIVAAPMPVSLNQSRSLTIPSFETLHPIQCHQTPVFARGGGFSNAACGSTGARPSAGAAATSTAWHAAMPARNDTTFFIQTSLFRPKRL